MTGTNGPVAPTAETALERRERRAAAFQFVVGPITVAAILIWLGMQSILPLFDPALLYLMLSAVGVLYYTEFVIRVMERRSKTLSAARWICLAIITIGGFIQMLNIGLISSETEDACERFRASFIATPDSNVSDAYEALHCSQNIESRVKKIIAGKQRWPSF